jgi:hypothetical protein
MKIFGFTGTRSGMTDAQKAAVIAILDEYDEKYKDPDGTLPEFQGLHGDCIGADEDFDDICNGIGMETFCRPCTFKNMRANTGAFESAEPKPPMQRNRDIVASADIMIACPPNFEPIKKGSGTWATIGFTRKAGKPLVIIYPDGSVARERIEATP